MTVTFALLATLTLSTFEPGSESGRPFAITVVDEQTGRGVPLVELKTVNDVRYVTDSAGLAAVFEPGLMGKSVYFHVKSHGYEYPKDGFGNRGKALTLEEGGSATLRIRRGNVAERLYRVTGAGIYRDSVLLGRAPPIRSPLLNAGVLGQDSVLTGRYRGKLYWFWGDTNRAGYPLGNFHTPGATSDRPEDGGLDPEVGVDLSYFVDSKTGFVKPTAEMPGEGPTWLSGLAVFRDEDDGRERMVAGYAKIKPVMETYEYGLVEFNPLQNVFEKVATFPLDSALRPQGSTFRKTEAGIDYIYYCTPYPLTRVRARMADLKDVTKYEGFTPRKTGSRRKASAFDDALRYAWRADTALLLPNEESGVIPADQASKGLVGLRDIETNDPIWAHSGSVSWNAYRNRWVMITVQGGGKSSFLGEVWFAEADTPLGPWAYARKVVTHDKYSFYNPLHHSELDKNGGRIIFFEGTYATTFSREVDPTPRYDYNQVMYRLDLSDPRLNLPVPVYARADGTYGTGPTASRASGGTPPAFFALEKPSPAAFAVVSTNQGFRTAETNETPSFFAPTAEAKDRPRALVRLDSVVDAKGLPSVLVWRAPSVARLPAP